MSRYRPSHDPSPPPIQDTDPSPPPIQDTDPSPPPIQDTDPSPPPIQDTDPSPPPIQDTDPSPPPIQDTDPDAAYALRLLQQRLGDKHCGRRRKRGGSGVPQRPEHLVQAGNKPDYSGYIIVRLSGHLDLEKAQDDDSLACLAETLCLEGLKQVLRRNELTSSKRLVKNEVDNKDPEHRCGCSDLSKEQSKEQEQPCKCRKCNTVTELERKAVSSLLPPLHSLNSYWRIDVSGKIKEPKLLKGELSLNGWEPDHEYTVRRILRQLNELDEVDRAYRELAVTDPAPIRPVSNDTYSLLQEYLERAPVGIDVRWARDQQNGRGSGVMLVDLEQGWIPEHQDLQHRQESPLVVVGDNRHGKGEYRGHHGSAVLGEIVGQEDSARGVVGIAPQVRRVLRVSHYNDADETVLNVTEAIRQAIPLMDPGDVLLLEVQRSYLPTEVEDEDRDAIRLAVASGIIVVECAGNGDWDLDRYLDEDGYRILDRRSQEFVESGAIMVGAALPDLPHNRFSGPVAVGSNYGSRLDCFAYGTGVTTAGYGRLDVESEPPLGEAAAAQQAYTDAFGGTSGAAPIIAGAALVVQGMYEARCGIRLSPWEMRGILSDPRRGTKQGSGVPGYIGIMPDLRAILRDRLQLAPNLYLRDDPEDTGAVPAKSRIGASPDIIVADKTMPPDFGEGSGTEKSYVGCFKCKPGHLLYLRMRNSGLVPAERPEATVYWSEVATLVTPDKWKKIVVPSSSIKLAAAQPVVNAGDTLVVSEPIPLSNQGISKSAALPDQPGHVCFSAILGNTDPNEHKPGHEKVILPPFHPPYFDWNEFRTFLRENNSVAIRNVHLMDEFPPNPATAADITLPFRFSGTPDRARVFDFEIVQRLPDGARVELHVPPPLAARLLRRRLWNKGQNGTTTEIYLPPQPRIGIGGVRLIAGAWFESGFRIRGSGIAEGHSLAIRQFYGGEEVGRITWVFRRRPEKPKETASAK